ncbi:hypothetical protein EC968_001922 [Mortierella alpina]|nr:hypothetical protein EC968_001922 [Mortierella alpina]
MLSVLHPSSSPCLHLPARPSTPATPATPAPSAASTASTATYKQLVATFTAHAPQPYGTIPRRKRASAGRPRSTSTSSFPPPTSSIDASASSSRNSLELLPTYRSSATTNTTDSGDLSKAFSTSTSSYSRSSLWATLKAHYLGSTYNLPWAITSGHRKRSSRRSTEFTPLGLLVSRSSSPVVTLDARPLVPASSSAADDALLSLPNLDSLQLQNNDGSLSGSYPVSVAAMDKLKVVRSDTIALKTFTYRETPVVEVKRPALPTVSHVSKRITRSSTTTPKPVVAAGAAADETSASVAGEKVETPLPLPRHLACRETRSNSDHLRMMASELRMIRSRKLIAPLKPRGYLPRRKEVFRAVKSSLSVALEIPCTEDDHPLNNLLVGSWSSTESFLSTTSSDYATADEEF